MWRKNSFLKKVLDARPNRFIMAIFVNTLGQRWTKWNFTKWAIKRKTWTWLEFIANGGNCTNPYLTPPQLSCYKTKQVSRNQGHKQLAKHEIWMVDLLWWPIKVINIFQTYLLEIRTNCLQKKMVSWNPNYLSRTIP